MGRGLLPAQPYLRTNGTYFPQVRRKVSEVDLKELSETRSNPERGQQLGQAHPDGNDEGITEKMKPVFSPETKSVDGGVVTKILLRRDVSPLKGKVEIIHGVNH
jgi:hypothetical protein